MLLVFHYIMHVILIGIPQSCSAQLRCFICGFSLLMLCTGNLLVSGTPATNCEPIEVMVGHLVGAVCQLFNYDQTTSVHVAWALKQTGHN